eukprot:jgi/Botrbrau1/9519/Bobra.0211s0010.1
MASMEELLPSSLSDFRTLEFWNRFFKARGNLPFEWYGDWKQLKELASTICQPGKRVLVVGCGNSELSAQMYDDGCTDITNIDFSPGVIRDMMVKHIRARPSMRWLVMDMTQMKFEDGSFDVVVDKGGLDALMGEESGASRQAGGALLSQVKRILKPEGGTYLCVSLAQPHVLETLLGHMGAGWGVEIGRLSPDEDTALSELQPLLITVSRAEKASWSLPETPLFPHSASALNAAQLADVSRVVEEERQRRKWRTMSLSPDLKPPDIFWELIPGRRVVVDLPLDTSQENAGDVSAAQQREFSAVHVQETSAVQGQGAAAAAEASRVALDGKDGPAHAGTANGYCGTGVQPRFCAAVLDVDAGRMRAAARTCAVFIVPQGREHEWVFASEEGQRQIAAQCSTGRLIVLSLSHCQQYGSLEEVKKEASREVLPLLPGLVRGSPAAVPIMTTDDGIGHRTTLETASSAISGSIVVEDVEEGTGKDRKRLRRMVFLSNRGLIQSEVRLQPAPAAAAGGGAAPPSAGGSAASPSPSKGKKGKGRGKGKPPGRKEPGDAGGSSGKDDGGAGPLAVDHSCLSFSYHKAVVAATSLVAGIPKGKAWRAMVIGVGGGSLPNFLNRQLGMHVTAVELDPVVLELARRHFDLQEGSSIELRVQDGLEAVQEAAQAAAALATASTGAKDSAGRNTSLESASTDASGDPAVSAASGSPTGPAVGSAASTKPPACLVSSGVTEPTPSIQAGGDIAAPSPAPNSLSDAYDASSDTPDTSASTAGFSPAPAEPAAPAGAGGAQSESSSTREDGETEGGTTARGGTARVPGPGGSTLTQSSPQQDASRGRAEGPGCDTLSQSSPQEAPSGPAARYLDLLVVDAGSGDASQAMSCPPAPFLEEAFLQNARRALGGSGLIAMNCVTRSPAALQAALASVKGQFRNVWACHIPQDVNCVLLASDAKQPPRSGLKERGSLKSRLHELWPTLPDLAAIKELLAHVAVQ